MIFDAVEAFEIVVHSILDSRQDIVKRPYQIDAMNR